MTSNRRTPPGPSKLAHASSASSLFRVIVASVSLGGVCAASLFACGVPAGTANIGNGDASISEDADSSDETCRPAIDIDGGVDADCTGGTIIPVTGDFNACGFKGGDEFEDDKLCEKFCGPGLSCKLAPTDSVNVACYGVCVGRPYDNLDHSLAPEATDVGSAFARMAFFEAASIESFQVLTEELQFHGAPRKLIHAAKMAREDEVAHARMARSMAQKFGVTSVVEPPEREPCTIRTLEDMAIENAIEGCVNETFGALVGTWQAAHARDSRIRTFFKRIARDETRHASLSHRVNAWAMKNLPPDARKRVQLARKKAVGDLARTIETSPPPAIPSMGVPSPSEFRALLASVLPSVAA